jgi:molybdopterin molybdotransferase
MITVNEALDLIRAHFIILSKAKMSLHELEGQVLAQEVRAERDQPPFDRVAMDGIAIKWSEDVRTFPLDGVQRAGEPAKSLKSSIHAIEVMTGAPLPIGTDTVIPYEVIDVRDKNVSLLAGIKVDKLQNIHFKGSDYLRDEIVLSSGEKISSPVVAVLASQGLTEVEVVKYPQIAVISTGDELIDPREGKIKEHQIRRSNPHAIAAELRAAGFPSHKINLFHLKDEKNEMYNAIQNYLNQYDVLILSGGVSKGKFDFIPAVMGDLGVKTHFHTIRQKPGKPMLFGTGTRGQMIFGLPGNPVSALVCLRRYVIEVFREKFIKSKGHCLFAKLAEDIEFRKPMSLFQSIKLSSDAQGTLVATPIVGNGSGDFSSLALSDGFLELPADQNNFVAGQAFPLFLWKGRNL